ncbi:hypothetical protein [Niveispirillum irakense]|uniref:hypothetical protein n=1 Tax=Niveispirillum irakense TaxID=34011 RepID=UPI00040F1589|nr:hypothetical protein [Niveispirillum irakense]
MIPRFLLALTGLSLITPTASALEPGVPPVPAAVSALTGCWKGEGVVMDKKVSISLSARAVALDAMFAIDSDSTTIGDPSDRYAAHLLFGAGSAKDDKAVSGFWSDSFGGTFTAIGTGSVQPGGFDISYQYPDSLFINRWRMGDTGLRWDIIARDANGKEAPFAAYTLTRAACP